MRWINNLKIKTKMLLSFTLVILLMASMSVFSVLELKSIDHTYDTVIKHPLVGRTAMLEFQSTFRDLRRIIATLSTYSGYDMDKCESLFNDAINSYNTSLKYLDGYDDAVNTHPNYTDADKKARMENTIEIRRLAQKYYDDFMIPMKNAALAGSHELSLSTIETSGPIATDIRNKVIEVLEASDIVVQTQSDEATKSANGAVVLLILISAIAALVAIFIALMIAQSISKPIIALTAYMNQAGTKGKISVTAEEKAAFDKFGEYKDEVGQCIASTAKFVAHITDVNKILEDIAKADISADVIPLSETDSMGISLKMMVENLNNMFGEINASTAQVSTGSKQIADGSQILAQGSAEQASAVEQLSSSVSEVSLKTKTNAETAEKAAQLAEVIKSNAEKGSRQMDEMVSAVKEINLASQNISKVIKVIDDIAFQTNILALNAAVEAARAGQHGKGFAVVAEEVRNLAAKSAEAAKDTGGLISNSIEKAELGAKIADETATSLADIVTGINESSQLVGAIARSSDEQSEGITQINKGIDQVAQTIQQTSATAEESAAASEEMSGQAIALENLIAQFKLKNDSALQISAPQKRLAMSEKAESQSDTGNFDKY